MLAVNYSTLRNNLKNYCDEASDNNQTVIITRKNEKNVVIMSLENYNQLMKRIRNAEYLAKLDRSIEQIQKIWFWKHTLIYTYKLYKEGNYRARIIKIWKYHT